MYVANVLPRNGNRKVSIIGSRCAPMTMVFGHDFSKFIIQNITISPDEVVEEAKCNDHNFIYFVLKLWSVHFICFV